MYLQLKHLEIREIESDDSMVVLIDLQELTRTKMCKYNHILSGMNGCGM